MGELVRGLLLHQAAVTATGNGTAFQVGAVEVGQRLVATLHVTAASGGGTLTVAVQSDDAQGMGTPTTRITFDAMTAVGSQQKYISSSVADTWERSQHTITGGSSPSFTYVVTVGVAGAASGVAATLPPAGQANLVLASPLGLGAGAQSITMLVGPAGQLGSAAGSDTNDPTYGAGPPPLFVFDANDYITWGDVLDSTFTGAFSIMVATWPDAVDVGGAVNRGILDKDSAAASTFLFILNNGKPRLSPFYAGVSGQGDDYIADVALSAAKHRLSVSFDPALGRTVRAVLYDNGASIALTNAPNGTDGVIVDTSAALRQGLGDRTAIVGLSVMGPVYIWNRVLSASEMLQNSDWLATQSW